MTRASPSGIASLGEYAREALTSASGPFTLDGPTRIAPVAGGHVFGNGRMLVIAAGAHTDMRILMTMVLMMVSSAHALAAELTVLASVAARDYIDEMVPEWKASTGNMLFIEYNSGAEVRKKVDAGAAFDVVISFAPDLEGMRKALQVETEGSMIGTAYLVIVYKRGTEAPEAATPDQFKALIESMPSFAMSDPAGGGVGPVLVVDTAQRMGV